MATQPGNIGQYKRGCNNQYISKKKSNVRRGGKRGR